MRKKLVAVGSAIGIAALSLMSAVPAQAADQTIDCASTIQASPTLVPLSVNDTYTIQNSASGLDGFCKNIGISGGTAGVLSWTDNSTPGTATLAPGATLVVTAVTEGSATLEIGNNDEDVVVFYLNALVSGGGGGGGGDESSSTDASSGPAPAMQQFGKPESMTCDEAQPEGLNWSGVPSGGWGESWAQWMNGGNGGTICTRELVYRAGTWAIN